MPVLKTSEYNFYDKEIYYLKWSPITILPFRFGSKDLMQLQILNRLQKISIRQPHTTVRNMVYATYKNHLQTDTHISQSDIELELDLIIVKFDKKI